MLILRNIKRNDLTIEAEYFPENGKSAGFLRVKMGTGEVLEHRKAKGYEYSTAPSHAKNELIRLSKRERLPEEKTVMWF